MINKKIKKALPLTNFKYITFVFAGAVQSALSVVFALAVKNLINSVEYGLGKDDILFSSLVLIGVVVISYLLGVAVKLLGDNIVTQAEYTLKSTVTKNYLSGSYKNSSRISSGDLLTRFEGDVSTVAGVRINLLPNVVSTIVRLIGTVVALFILQPTFTLIVLLVAFIIVGCSFVIRKISYRLYKSERIENSKQNSYLAEVSSNLMAVKTFNAEDFTDEELSNKYTSYKKARRMQRYFLSGVSSIINLCFTSFYVSAVIFGVYSIYNGINGVDFGVITALLQLVLQIKAPVTGISGFFTAHAQMLVAGERLFAIKGEEDIKIPLSDFDKICLSEVDFSYGNGLIFSGANLEIKKGEKILIKGGSGEGKTTLVKLLLGLYKPTNGKVFISVGKAEYFPSEVKDFYSFVPQGNMLFSKSIKENIVFNSEYDRDKFIKAIEIAGLSEVVNEYGEEYYLGEGNSLSEGQRQRLAVARAIYKNASVIILDEPTSALDKDTELQLARSLCALKDVTLIIISHKPAIEEFVDRIITIDGGRII